MQSVIDVLNDHSGVRLRNWRFNLLNHNGLDWTYKSDLTPWVTQASIVHDRTSAVKRTLSLTMTDTAASSTVDINGNVIGQAPIDYLYDWIQPVYRLRDPATGTWLEWPLGVFCFTDPSVMMAGYMVEGQRQLADLTYLVSRVQSTTATNPTTIKNPDGGGTTSTYAQPIVIPGGTNVMAAIIALLCNPPDNDGDISGGLAAIPGCGLDVRMLDGNIFNAALFDAVVAPSGYQVSPGTSYLDVVNQFLYYLGCDQVWCTAGAICNSGSVGITHGAQNTRNGTVTSNNGPILTTQKWPPNLDYTGPTVHCEYLYSTQQGTNVSVPLRVNDGSPGGGNYVGSVATGINFRDSVVLPGTTEALRMDQMANVVNVIIEDAGRDQTAIVLTNTNPSSPISIPNYKTRVAKVIQDNAIPSVTSVNWANLIAQYEMTVASSIVDVVTLMTAVQPCHEDSDIIGLNIYADYVGFDSGSGSYKLEHQPIVIGDVEGTGTPRIPGLVVSEKFLETGWSIQINLPTPGSGNDMVVTGVTTGIEAQTSRPGGTMTHTLQRVTSITPDGHYS